MEKTPSTSDYEVGSHHHDDAHLRSKIKAIRAVDSARVTTTLLALFMGMCVLGTSANTLRVYDDTRLGPDNYLSLWPDEFNIRPTVALVVGSAIVLVSNLVALSFGKVQYLQSKATAQTAVRFLAPFVGLTAALIAIIFFYTVNASNTVDTFLSWTCRWKSVPMWQQPHWDTLCKQSEAGVYLSILLIPVEAVALGLAGFQMRAERYVNAYTSARKSPALS